MGRAQDVPNAESYRYKVTSVIAILTYLKFSRFPHKDKSENTFIKICLPVSRRNKGNKNIKTVP